MASEKYRDADIVNIDGDLIRIQKDTIKDSDYWVDASISKNRKGQLQLMVIAGDRSGNNKAQLFLDINNQKLTFDQNNDHPREIFSKVIALFKESESSISDKRST